MISEKALRSAAKELNELGLDPAINVKLAVKELTKKVAEVINGKDDDGDPFITEDDEFTDATQAVIDELKVDEEEAEEEETEEVEETEAEEVEEEVEVKNPAAKPKKEVGKRPASGYSRTDSVCDGLKGKPKTIADWVTKANAAMVKNGGKANDSETKAIIKLASVILKNFSEVKYPTA